MIRLLFFEYEPRLIDDRLIRNIKKKMYFVKKRMEVAGCHSLSLSYPSKCSQRHGHNWVITVYCRAKELNPDGMVCDFTHIKERIMIILTTEILMTCYHLTLLLKILQNGLLI